MVTPTTTFRLSAAERRQLERLADELVCSRSDVLRYGMAALRDDPGLRQQIKADNLARTFLKSLRTQYGDDATLELVDGPEDSHWRLAGEPLDDQPVDVLVERQGDRWILDLVDEVTGVAIHNIMSWEDEEGHRHAVVSLRDLWVHTSHGAIGEPRTRQLYDGRTVVQIEEDDGSVRHLAIDNRGNSALVREEDVPLAAFTSVEPSVGIGVRRDSTQAPHLGEGFGAKRVLTGDLDADRAAVVEALEALLRQAKEGGLDSILKVGSPRSPGSPAARSGPRRG
jgi:hypothetical protein